MPETSRAPEGALSEDLFAAADALDKGMGWFKDGAKVRQAARIVEAAKHLRDEPHIVRFSHSGWQLGHTIQCRLDGMLDCKIDAVLQSWPKPTDDEMGMFNIRLIQSADGDDADVELWRREDDTDPAQALLDALEDADGR